MRIVIINSPTRGISMSATKKATKTATKTAAKTAAATGKKYDGFTPEERAAMKERATELKAEARRSGKKTEEESAVLEKIAEMSPSDRAMAEKLHAIVKASAPGLSAKLWYGMPSYARDGKIVCFFQPADKFSTRYATLGFNDAASLDDGTMWPTAFALTKLTAADEKKIGALIKKAAG
jgi:uncharacterized protein YdhG (YjbR/CyaY superfamily)